MIIRDATLADAGAMAAVREASIRELCCADHQNEAVAIDAWVGSPDKFVRLLDVPQVTLIVADLDGAIAGLGGLYGDSVTLSYVHPDYRLCGISKAIMLDLETRLNNSGVALGRLNSTVTAVRFYRSIGWIEVGVADLNTGQPMTKRL